MILRATCLARLQSLTCPHLPVRPDRREGMTAVLGECLEHGEGGERLAHLAFHDFHGHSERHAAETQVEAKRSVSKTAETTGVRETHSALIMPVTRPTLCLSPYSLCCMRYVIGRGCTLSLGHLWWTENARKLRVKWAIVTHRRIYELTCICDNVDDELGSTYPRSLISIVDSMP